MAKTLLSRTAAVSKSSRFQGDRKEALHDRFLSKRWRWLRGWILPITLVIAWEILSRVGFFPPNLLPDVSR